MPHHRYNVSIRFNVAQVKTVQVVLEETTENKKRVFLVTETDLIELDDCNHTCDNPSKPVDGTSKLKLKGLGKAFGIDLKGGTFDAARSAFVFKKTKISPTASGDWEATDNGPWPHPFTE